MRSAPPDAATARFVEDLSNIAAPAGRLGVAVSGGPDSLALMLLANAAYPGRCHVATVNHRLRPESAAEADFVATLCDELGVPHRTLTIDEPPGGNLQDWARRVRYAALDAWAEANALDFYLTAHHADDQLETLVMRFNRGSGVAGLAGIRARQGRVVRPLLTWRRNELAEIVAQAGIEAVRDPANTDNRFDRARLRKHLATSDWLDPLAASRSAAALEQAEDALAWATSAEARTRILASDDGVSLDPDDIPAEILRRLIAHCLSRVAPAANPRGAEVSRLIATLSTGGTATLAGVRCVGGTRWRFTPAPRRRGN